MQKELGDRIACRGLSGAVPQLMSTPSPDADTFASEFGTAIAETRATHRKPKRKYKTRVRMPSKVSPSAIPKRLGPSSIRSCSGC